MEAPILYLVIPCYNEEKALPFTVKAVDDLLKKNVQAGTISPSSRCLLVNDGSKDRTWEMIRETHEHNPYFNGICLSRNRGHQNALLAGLFTASVYCDCAISMDADLQDDIGAVEKMLAAYQEGYDVVYGVRNSRETDTAFKRMTAQAYYKLLSHLGADIVYNHADFRLLSRRALEALQEFPEVNLFLRGLVPMLGFPATKVYYDRAERVAGESKYPLKKMLSFAFEGITSLSNRPIRWIFRLGLFIFIISLFMLLYSIIQYFRGHTVAGWASLITSLWAIGGLILLSLGIIGEYIGKTYLEAKHRPRFFIQEALLDAPEERD